MVDGEMKLSQDEIDALLRAGVAEQAAAGGGQGPLTEGEIDVLGELGNICFGSAATSLSSLLGRRVDITTPVVSILPRSEVESRFPTPYVLVQVDFTEGLQGTNALAIEIEDARRIADLMIGRTPGESTGDLGELELSAVGEAMNQMMGSAATAMSQLFGRYINISPPSVRVVTFTPDEAQAAFGSAEQLVNVEFRLHVHELIDSHIMQLMPVPFARELVQSMHIHTEAIAPEPPDSDDRRDGDGGATESAKTLEKVGDGGQAARGREEEVPSVSVRRPAFADFDDGPSPRDGRSVANLSLLYDVPLNVTVELGRARKLIREILELAPGSILELDKLAGEPVDIYVNQKKIAIGEVVVIDENFGVRVTDIVQADKRIDPLP
ncbi:flagellar motor switch phosphatase FliY [Alicyclobacillus mali]|uniref:Flagellar motor switch phosphatase FliY n=1 Tax=Alicyclobacillus mali (ex Roth et al. 2021) TaxID=1123961 RepID=A0ABS0F1P6_9BACL|nr:flagellar motor switch phosphatase FliY [Alicyclobacillus mali (ex Roth et al. 2021)]MBF8377232.1 flagellar motor switch phosphatase FliY [Alicyclobacillus mali (ex Roth et al. 2021)]MCL6488119.1 flagellar motor switch phosphatase FliY [Alicyclobacillus mali (ex Roth et al. 2021)]